MQNVPRTSKAYQVERAKYAPHLQTYQVERADCALDLKGLPG